MQLALRLKQSPVSPLPNHIFNPYAYVKLNYGTLYKGITSVPCRRRRKETKKKKKRRGEMKTRKVREWRGKRKMED